MVKLFSSDGYHSFLARGAEKPTGKAFGAVQLLSYSKISCLSGTSGGLSFKEGVSLKQADGRDSLERLSAYSFLAELTDKLIQEDEAVEAYPWFAEAMKALEGSFSPFTAILIVLAHDLEIAGYSLEVDECVSCGSKKNIAGISYSEGGFVCQNDLSDATEACSARKLKIIRYLFKCTIADFSRVSFEKDECQDLLRELSQYLNDLTGVTLKSLDLLLKA